MLQRFEFYQSFIISLYDEDDKAVNIEIIWSDNINGFSVASGCQHFLLFNTKKHFSYLFNLKNASLQLWDKLKNLNVNMA